MSYWHLIVVLCFAVLYLGISVVFTRLSRLQKEMRADHARVRELLFDPEAVALACTESIGQQLTAMEERSRAQIEAMGSEMVGQQLTAMEERMGVRIQTMGELLQGDLQILQNELRSVAQKEDTYREARLLLSYGVEEEHVAAETGQSMEEIRLLKRITNLKQRFSQGTPPVLAQPVATRWKYAPMDHLNVDPEGLARLLVSDSAHKDHHNQSLELQTRLGKSGQENTAQMTNRSQQKRHRHGRGRWRQGKNRGAHQNQGHHSQKMQTNPAVLPTRLAERHS